MISLAWSSDDFAPRSDRLEIPFDTLNELRVGLIKPTGTPLGISVPSGETEFRKAPLLISSCRSRRPALRTLRKIDSFSPAVKK